MTHGANDYCLIQNYSGHETVITVLSTDNLDTLFRQNGYQLAAAYKDEMVDFETMYKGGRTPECVRQSCYYNRIYTYI